MLDNPGLAYGSPMTTPTLADVWTWLQANTGLLITISGAITAAILIALIARAYRRGGIDSATMLIAAPLVIGWEAEGIYEVLRSTNAHWSLAVLGCSMTSMVMVNLGAKGHRHFQEHGTIGPNGRTVWYIAIPVGVIVAASATTASMQGLRILIPVLGATLWWSEYRPDEPKGQKKDKGSFRWTPRNFGIWIGAITPGDDDVETLHHARGVRQLIRAQYALRYGGFGTRSWRERRLRKVARFVDDDMVREAYEQMTRVELVVEMGQPGFVPPEFLNEPENTERPAKSPGAGGAAKTPAAKGAKKGGAAVRKWQPQSVLRQRALDYMAENPGVGKEATAKALGYDPRYLRRVLGPDQKTTVNGHDHAAATAQA